MTNHKEKMNRGFTLVETLVAVTILVLVVTGATSALQSSISSYTISKDEAIALYLAQEGFEQIKNLRDENILKGQNWLSGIAETGADPCTFGSYCRVSPVETPILNQCGLVAGSCAFLRQDVTSGFYGYNAGWTLSQFKREVKLTSINANEVSVTVTVSWSKGSVSRQFKARDNIFKYQ